MVTRRGFLALSAAGAVVIAGVGGFRLLPDQSTSSGEPEIRYGGETCARCSMIISDRRFAAAWRDPNGNEQHCDDIGCMIFLIGERHPASGTRYWVHDYETEGWLEAAGASYIVSDTIKSPMGYGVAASASSEGARRIAGRLQEANVAEWTRLAGSLVKRG